MIAVPHQMEVQKATRPLRVNRVPSPHQLLLLRKVILGQPLTRLQNRGLQSPKRQNLRKTLRALLSHQLPNRLQRLLQLQSSKNLVLAVLALAAGPQVKGGPYLAVLALAAGPQVKTSTVPLQL